MLRFAREKILQLFLQRQITIAELARLAKVSPQSAKKAIDGDSVNPVIVAKIAAAMELDPLEFIERR